MMEININFVFFEELGAKPEGAVETRIAIIRHGKDLDSSFEDGATDLDLSE